MREHMGLYRGKRKDNGEWIEGQIYIRRLFYGDKSTAVFIITSSESLCYYQALEYYEVDPDTVGECTGLRDKNGKLIFEGDIVKSHYANVKKTDFVEEVVFHNGKFCALFQKDGGKMWCPLADGVPHHPGDKTAYMEWCEVIGNIHDNPELLKGGEGDS